VHDIVNLERRSIPSVMVASTVFVEAAEIQASALGLAVARVFVPHPIQGRTDEQMRSLADDAFEEILSKIIVAS
jgi:hypothetical protein